MARGNVAEKMEAMRDAAAETFARAGYSPVDPPIFAQADIFLDRLGEQFRRQTCFFEDGMGQELCLRPELTIPVCRMALENGFDASAAMRLRYCGPVFRLTQAGSGGLGQSIQAGVELLGQTDTASADAEIISLCLSALERQGLSEVRVTLGDAGAFAELLAGLRLRDRQRAHVKSLFDAFGSSLSERLPPEAAKAPRPGLDFDLALAQTETELEAKGLGITGGRSSSDIAKRLADRSGREQASAIPAAARTALADFFALKAPIHQAAKELETFFDGIGVASHAPQRSSALSAALLSRGLPVERLTFDARVHAPLGYYTGLEFSVEAGGKTVAGGGRYDGLVGEIADRRDWRVPAVGCALFLDDILSVTG
jgi:ATP phosphoribosyltransferase regulatory subunit